MSTILAAARRKTAAVTAATGLALAGSLALGAAPASAAGITCTATAAAPVVVVENGVRYLQTYSTVRCTGTLSWIKTATILQNSSYSVMNSAGNTFTNTSSVNVRLRYRCSNVVNNNYRTLFYVTSSAGHDLSPVSGWTLRSCG